MATNKDSLTREERLAAKLRENLKRRKEQARAQARTQASTTTGQPQADEAGTLPKKPDRG